MKEDRHPMAGDRTAELAARKIIELIHSRPYSPRQDEIAGIIRKLAAEAAPQRDIDPLDLEYGPAIK